MINFKNIMQESAALKEINYLNYVKNQQHFVKFEEYFIDRE